MGNGHRVAYDLHNADLTIEDPGNAGRISVDRLPGFVNLVSGGVETRYLANPSRSGQQVTLCCPANSVYLAYNSDLETLVLDTADEAVTFLAINDGTSFKWKPIIGAASDATAAFEGIADLTAITAADIDDDAVVEFGVIQGTDAKSVTLAELKKTGVQVYNVLQYGAVGDGTTDDTAAIQAALDAASAARAASTYAAPIVFLPPGEYKTTDELDFDGRIHFRGSGINATVINFEPATGSTEGLACLSVKGGPTSNDYIYFPEVSGLSISLVQGAAQTAVRRYGVYLLYPTRAFVHDLEVKSSAAITSKDWVGLRTGREQGRYWNLTFTYIPVPLYLDGGDNNSFHNISYIGSGASPSTLPRTAIYGDPTGAWDRYQFTGNHTVVDYDYGIYWNNISGTSAGGFSVSGMRTEQGDNASAYWIYLPGTSVIHSVDISNCYFGGTVQGMYLRNIWNFAANSCRFTAAAKLVDLDSTVVWSWADGSFADTASASFGAGFPSHTNIHYYKQESREWMINWTASDTTPEIQPSFHCYKTNNASPTTITAFDGTYFNSGRGIGHVIYVLVDTNTTITHGSGITLSSGNNYTPPTTRVLTFVKTFTDWTEVANSPQPAIEASTAGSGAPNVLTGAEAGKLLTNEGTTAVNYHTLPTAVAGLTYTFVVQDADGLRITASTDDTIRLGSKVTATAGYIESTTIGDYVTLTAINATEWLGLAYGTWTDGTFTYTVVTST